MFIVILKVTIKKMTKDHVRKGYHTKIQLNTKKSVVFIPRLLMEEWRNNIYIYNS